MNTVAENFMSAWQRDYLRIIHDIQQKEQAMNTPPDTHHTPSPGLHHPEEAVKKVLYFSDGNTPPARRAHPADRVTDNRRVFHKRWYRIDEATNFTEVGQ